MSYLHCARCRLAITRGVNCVSPTNCPRCLARAAVTSPLFGSTLNGVELRDKVRSGTVYARSAAGR